MLGRTVLLGLRDLLIARDLKCGRHVSSALDCYSDSGFDDSGHISPLQAIYVLHRNIIPRIIS
jgi:hypothetical protein